MSTNSPPYLSDLLTVYTAARQLRSSSDNSVLRRPSVRTVSYGQRSFACSAPSAWNSLPQQVRSSDKMSLLSDPELKHTFSVLPTNYLDVSDVNVICFPQSFISCTVGWVGVFAMSCQCSVTVTMFRNNVLQLFCICNLLYACNRLCAPWTLEK